MNGDKNRKFEGIYEEFGSLIYRELVMILKDYSLADDAMQQVLIRVAGNIELIEIDDKTRLWHYLNTIAKNVAYTMCEKQKREICVDIEDMQIMDEREFENDILQNVTYEKLISAIRKLGDGDRNILMMYYFDEWSVKKIAALTGASYEAAKKRLQRAVGRLARLVKKEDFYE